MFIRRMCVPRCECGTLMNTNRPTQLSTMVNKLANIMFDIKAKRQGKYKMNIIIIVIIVVVDVVVVVVIVS